MGIQERKERERERRRQQIIIAAKRVFSAKGFNKATACSFFTATANSGSKYMTQFNRGIGEFTKENSYRFKPFKPGSISKAERR